MMPHKKTLYEILIAWVAVILISRGASTLSFIPLIKDNVSLITAVLLLYIPIGIHLKMKEKISYVDESVKSFVYSFRDFLIVSIIIFPPLFLGNHVYQSLLGLSYHSGEFAKIGELILYQLFMVAFPEEFFFRGYFQGRLNKIFGKPWKILGVSYGPGLLWCSLVFALSHSFIHYQWWHIFIFFPALLFGWLREKSGRITASLFFHALCNMFSQWVVIHYS